MTYDNLYPKLERDTLDKVANANCEGGADVLHTVVPQGPTGSAYQLPRPAPSKPEGVK